MAEKFETILSEAAGMGPGVAKLVIRAYFVGRRDGADAMAGDLKVAFGLDLQPKRVGA